LHATVRGSASFEALLHLGTDLRSPLPNEILLRIRLADLTEDSQLARNSLTLVLLLST
jgi:hypothetical protein